MTDTPPGPAFDAWRLPLFEPDALAALDRPAQLAYFARHGVLAPTPHNAVPERFRCTDRGLELWVDRASILPAADPEGRQTGIGLGCVAANIRLAAEAYGWEARPRVTGLTRECRPVAPGEPRYAPVMELALVPGERARFEPAILTAIRERRIVRAELDERVALDPETTAALRAAAVRPGLDIHILTDRPSLHFVGKFQEVAEATVFNREAFATELGEWMLPNESESKVGMRGREFGLDDRAAARLHLGLTRQIQLLPDEIAAFTHQANVSIRAASAVVVLTCVTDDLDGWLQAGDTYEEMALLLWNRGFVTAMQGSPVEVEAPNLALRARLRTSRRPTVVFRVGRPLRPEDARRPHAARPPLEELMLP